MPNSLSLISIPDWGKLTGKPSAFPPDLHKTSHQLGGADAIDCTGLAGRVNYVDRGNPYLWDWTHATLTTDNTWRDLDCNAIVPAGAKAILFYLHVSDDAIGGEFYLRKNGNLWTINWGGVINSVANQAFPAHIIIPCDANRVVEYRGTSKAWTAIAIAICGWFI